MPAGIATDHPPHTGHLGKQRLGTPETAAAKDCHINSSGIIRNPAQCKRIDTVAQPFRCRAVGEHMAEVRLADIAQGLDPLPAMRPITGIGNYSFVNGLCERRPAGAGIKFRARVEERFITTCTGIKTGLETAAHRRTERLLGTFQAHHRKLLRAELCAPLGVTTDKHTRRFGVALTGTAQDFWPVNHTFAPNQGTRQGTTSELHFTDFPFDRGSLTTFPTHPEVSR